MATLFHSLQFAYPLYEEQKRYTRDTRPNELICYNCVGRNCRVGAQKCSDAEAYCATIELYGDFFATHCLTLKIHWHILGSAKMPLAIEFSGHGCSQYLAVCVHNWLSNENQSSSYILDQIYVVERGTSLRFFGRTATYNINVIMYHCKESLRNNHSELDTNTGHWSTKTGKCTCERTILRYFCGIGHAVVGAEIVIHIECQCFLLVWTIA